jgi:thiamine-monophosphate kinase
MGLAGVNRPSEFELIAALFAPLAGEGAFGLLDDAAAIPMRAGCELAVTTDALVEGVHFLPTDPAETVAKKALRVNLSDLAAKGAEPAGYFLAVSLPARLSFDWLKAFARGLGEDQREFSVSLLGGDTTATPGPLTLTVTAAGYVPKNGMIHRAGAKPGDAVYVSGTVGDAGGGLEILTKRPSGTRMSRSEEELVSRYRVPTPRLALGRALRGVASASLDVSDGLLADLGHIADVSRVNITVAAGALPLSKPLKVLWGEDEDAALKAATAGDDYELAFTAASHGAVMAAAASAGVAVTRIGKVSAGRGVVLLGKNGEIPVRRAGYRHF